MDAIPDSMTVYDFTRRLKTLGGLTPNKYVAGIWTSEFCRLIVDLIHQIPELNTRV